MKAIAISRPGGPEVLEIVEREKPLPGEDEILVRVEAIGLNRPDVQQRRGLYPPPPEASDLPGLDIAGIVEAIGSGVTQWRIGDAVCALANGGGYAEYCAVPAVQAMPIPKGLGMVEGASLPEVYFTAWNNAVWLGRLAHGERLLVQGGTSGVGMAAIQIAHTLFDAQVFVTAGSEEKREVCRNLGVASAIDYQDPDWPDQVRAAAGGKGMDIILDAQAGSYLQKELDLLAYDGRLVLIASHLSETSQVNTRQLVRRRLTLCGSTLRPRPAVYKGRIATELVQKVWPLIEAGRISTRIHMVFPFDRMRDAHAMLDRNEQIGKIVVTV
jgi:putative PIG3 family NAD(P)H quinone oxidoreductase